jgi:Uma2 family endonuclease
VKTTIPLFRDLVVDPDIAGWRRERVPADFFGDDDAFTAVAPDWVCEVLSPSTEVVDRTKKMRIYRREGVGHLWLVDPLKRRLEVYTLGAGYLNHGRIDISGQDGRSRLSNLLRPVPCPARNF